MSRQNNTPNSGGSAFADADLEFRTVGVPASDPNSYAGINEWSGDQVGPFLFSAIPCVIMFAMSLWFVLAGVAGWEGTILWKGLAITNIYLFMALFTYWPYRVLGTSIGALCSAITFGVVVDTFPMPSEALYTYYVLIAFSLVASNWAKEVRS